MRQNAENWLEVADRVHKFRRDLLSEAQNKRLLAMTGELRLRLKEKADAAKLKLAIEALEGVLRETGGRLYPTSSLVENVEFFLVAAIVILGLRAYFIQPFKIPTHSMWPSYYGMTPQVYPRGESPAALRQAARLVTRGATNYTVKAPADGEVLLPILRDGYLAVSEKPGRTLLVFPTDLREYTISVGGHLVKFEVPADFDREHDVLAQAFFGGGQGSFRELFREAANRAGQLESSTLALQSGDRRGEVRVGWVPVGRRVRQGETILSFDILTGDLLFVDRLTYNFLTPKVGSGFVFKTGNIAGLRDRQGDKYFVKRLVGVPGDELEIKAPVLYRNGKPIEGAAAFDREARREGLYPGYVNTQAGRVVQDGVVESEGLLPPGRVVTVPPNKFFAMGDNSPKSLDSRYWGFVPDKDVIGRPLFIYYPLTSRWGPAH